MPTYEISVTRAFTASHSIRLGDGSPEPVHDHVWRATAAFRADRLDATMGVVLDFVQVERALGRLAGELQGSNLNSLPPMADGRCTAERVAEYLAGRLRDLLGGRDAYRLSVTEAPGCSAAYYPQGP